MALLREHFPVGELCCVSGPWFCLRKDQAGVAASPLIQLCFGNQSLGPNKLIACAAGLNTGRPVRADKGNYDFL